MRQQVQRHIGLLSVSYYDENRTGTLVSRIMTDVEGVRNLVGTGLVEFVGGMLTAVMVFFFLLHRSPTVTLTVFTVVGLFVFVLQHAFKTIRPIFRERGKSTPKLRPSHRVAGRRARHQGLSCGGARGAGVLSRRRALAGQRYEVAHHDQSSRSASTTVLGLVSALVMWLGGNLVLHSQWTVGDYFQYNVFLAVMVAPVFQIVNIGTQLTEAFAGLDRTNEIMSELEENKTPGRTEKMPPIKGTVHFEDVHFAYEPEKPVLHGISFLAEPGTVTALVGSSGSGKSTIISLVCAFHTPPQAAYSWTMWTLRTLT